MLLTVFGMPSGNGVENEKTNAWNTHTYPGFTASFFPDYCFYPRKHRLAQRASILARNVVAVLLVTHGASQWTLPATTGYVTYSCGTARDFHTVPF
jgi:hypothetical protein